MRKLGIGKRGSGVGAAIIGVVISLTVPPLSAAPPKLTFLFPAGAQRGQSLSITASGNFSAWPPVVWVDRPGVAIVADKDKGKLNVQVAADAVPGIYWLRVTDGEGASLKVTP